VSEGHVELYILADNRVRDSAFISTWGLSILVTLHNRNILFDVSPQWDIVRYNARLLKAPIDNVDYIVISHWHSDHAGGILDAIRYYNSLNRKVGVIVPSKKWFLLEAKANIIVGKRPVKIANEVFTSGVLRSIIKEQFLIINIKGKGPLILVGCAHPGIDVVLKHACKLLDTSSIYGLIGGYHINGLEAYNTLETLRRHNVKVIGPAHCTSDDAIEILRSNFEGTFIDIYTGLRLEL